jgi:hypothetical protein
MQEGAGTSTYLTVGMLAPWSFKLDPKEVNGIHVLASDFQVCREVPKACERVGSPDDAAKQRAAKQAEELGAALSR